MFYGILMLAVFMIGVCIAVFAAYKLSRGRHNPRWILLIAYGVFVMLISSVSNVHGGAAIEKKWLFSNESEYISPGWNLSPPWEYVEDHNLEGVRSEEVKVSGQTARVTVVCYYFILQTQDMVKKGEKLKDPKDCADRGLNLYRKGVLSPEGLGYMLNTEFAPMHTEVVIDQP